MWGPEPRAGMAQTTAASPAQRSPVWEQPGPSPPLLRDTIGAHLIVSGDIAICFAWGQAAALGIMGLGGTGTV